MRSPAELGIKNNTNICDVVDERNDGIAKVDDIRREIRVTSKNDRFTFSGATIKEERFKVSLRSKSARFNVSMIR